MRSAGAVFSFGLAAVGASSFCGVVFGVLTRELLADDRGVTLPFAMTSLTGVLVALTLGVGGSDLGAGAAREVVDFVDGVALGVATRGVRGVRAVRVEDKVGLSGGLVVLFDRSDDIGVTAFA